jgi:hypothetical protein
MVSCGEFPLPGLVMRGEDFGMSLTTRSVATEPRRPEWHGEPGPRMVEIAAAAGIGQVHG